MRDGFREITSGWMLVSGIVDLTDRIERSAEWTKANSPLEPDEQATIEMMNNAQIARCMPELIEVLGLSDQFGLPPDWRDHPEDTDG